MYCYWNEKVVKGFGYIEPGYIETSNNLDVVAISEIKQNGPATVLITTSGRKVVVKCQEEKNSKIMGLNMVLIKYLVPKQLYHDCIEEIFFESTEPIETARSIVVSRIGISDYDKIFNKFFGKVDQ